MPELDVKRSMLEVSDRNGSVFRVKGAQREAPLRHRGRAPFPLPQRVEARGPPVSFLAPLNNLPIIMQMSAPSIEELQAENARLRAEVNMLKGEGVERAKIEQMSSEVNDENPYR